MMTLQWRNDHVCFLRVSHPVNHTTHGHVLWHVLSRLSTRAYKSLSICYCKVCGLFFFPTSKKLKTLGGGRLAIFTLEIRVAFPCPRKTGCKSATVSNYHQTKAALPKRLKSSRLGNQISKLVERTVAIYHNQRCVFGVLAPLQL